MLSRILAYTVASDAPFDMDKWLVWMPDSTPFLPMSQLKDLYGYEKEHFLDWQLLNATCRRFRECGIPEFFSEKFIALSPLSVNALHYGNYSNLSPNLWAMLLTRVRHVVADVFDFGSGSPTGDVYLGRLLEYNHFPRLRSISIAIDCKDLFNFHLSHTISRWHRESVCPTRDIDLLTWSTFAFDRYQAPEKLVLALQKTGLETKGVTIDVVHPGRFDLWRSIFDDIEHEIPPKLEWLAETKAQTEAA